MNPPDFLVVGPTFRYTRHVERRLKAEGYSVKARSLEFPEHFMGYRNHAGQSPTILVCGREALTPKALDMLDELSHRLGHTVINYEEPR